MADDELAAETGQGPDSLRRSIAIRGVREDKREADFIFSTDSVDSYDERVEQDWQLERYHRNPVVLFAHNSRALPIGRAKNVAVVDGALQGTVVFVSEKANPLAEQVWQCIKEGALRAGSVGFIPHSYRWEKEDGKERLILSQNELLEWSVCPVGANADALLKMIEGIRAKALAEKPVAVAQHSPPANERGPEPQRSVVDEKEKAALLAQIAERDAQIKTLEVHNGAVEAKLKERDVDTKELEAKINDSATKIKALEAQCDHLVKERDALKIECDALNGQVLEAEVSALVGKKITPAEKADFVELRKLNKTLFEKMIAQRSDLALDQPIIPVEKNDAPPAPASGEAADDADWSALQKAAAQGRID